MVKKYLSLVVVIFLFSLGVKAQSLNERLQKLSGDVSKAYMSPAFNPFGANLNGGWFSAPPEPVKSKFNIEFGIVGMASQLSSDDSWFSLNTDFKFDKTQAQTLTKSVDAAVRDQVIQQILNRSFNVTISGPTITGSSINKISVLYAPKEGESFKVSDPNIPFPVYVDLPSQSIDLGVSGAISGIKYLPAAAPQLKVGTFYGTQAIIRFIPSTRITEQVGNLSFFGFGLQHNPNVWFNYEMPVDVSAGFLVQNISVGSIIDVNTLSYGVNVAKTFSFGWFGVTPIAGFLLESSNIKITYSQTINTDAGQENVNVNFDLDGINKSRFLTGFKIHLAVIDITGEYNFGKINSFTGGISFGF